MNPLHDEYDNQEYLIKFTHGDNKMTQHKLVLAAIVTLAVSISTASLAGEGNTFEKERLKTSPTSKLNSKENTRKQSLKNSSKKNKTTQRKSKETKKSVVKR